MSDKKIAVWSWRQAIELAPINEDSGKNIYDGFKPLTKLVLYTIGNDISDCGKFSRRTVKDLAKATGLSQRSVIGHLNRARNAGFLKTERSRNSAGHVVATRYYPQFPQQCELATAPADDVQRLDLEPKMRCDPACGKPKSHSDEMAEKSAKTQSANAALWGKPCHIQGSLCADFALPKCISCTLSIDTFPQTVPIEESASARDKQPELSDADKAKILKQCIAEALNDSRSRRITRDPNPDIVTPAEQAAIEATLLCKKAEPLHWERQRPSFPPPAGSRPSVSGEDLSDGRHDGRKALNRTAEPCSEEHGEDLKTRPLHPQSTGGKTGAALSRRERLGSEGGADLARQNADISPAQTAVMQDEVRFNERQPNRFVFSGLAAIGSALTGLFGLMIGEAIGHG